MQSGEQWIYHTVKRKRYVTNGNMQFELIHDKIIFYLLLINFCSICNAEFNDVKIPSTYSQVEWTAARFIHIVYMVVNGQTNFFSYEK